MELSETLKLLESLSHPSMHKLYVKNGVRNQYYGVKMGDIRSVAKKIKVDHNLAMSLWETSNIDARLLAILILDVKKLSIETIDKMVKSEDAAHVADWLSAYIIKEYPENEALRMQWMQSKHPMCLRAAWSLTAGRVTRTPEGIDINALLDRIEKEMPHADPKSQWTMNTCLAQIGIHHPMYRIRCLTMGEAMGIYRNYPVSKGCTSPFAPIWINEMVKRQTKS